MDVIATASRPGLTVARGVALTIGAVLGTGVISLPAMAAGIAGPASVVAWAALVVPSAPLALTFAALGALPRRRRDLDVCAAEPELAVVVILNDAGVAVVGLLGQRRPARERHRDAQKELVRAGRVDEAGARGEPVDHEASPGSGTPARKS